MVKRYDESQLSGIEQTPQGLFKVNLRATRTGVLRYLKDDGSESLELRAPEEVFRPDSMATLNAIPVTNDHPSENGQGTLVSIGNASTFMVGYTSAQAIIEENRYLSTQAVLISADTVSEIRSGKQQISAGYTCDVIPETGTFEGQIYNGRQTNIIYNHVAIVDRGRAGPDVCIKLDSGDGIETVNGSRAGGEKKTMLIKMGDEEYEVADDFGQAFTEFMEALGAEEEDDDDDEKNKKDDDKDKDSTGKESMDSLRAKVDHLESTNRKLTKQIKQKSDSLSGDALHKLVLQRTSLLQVAKKLVDSATHTKLDTMADMDIKRLVILAEDPSAKLEGEPAGYINGRFDQIASAVGKSKKIHADMGKSILDRSKTDADDQNIGSKVEKAKIAARERLENAWKIPKSSNA